MYTYEDIELLAAELVGYSDLYASKDDAITLCLQAGMLRGLMDGGEPINSDLFIRQIEQAHQLLAVRSSHVST